jgi:flavin reductase (DIM6/NTAB) family NADH-FMN oxidoreductase RutF
MGAFVTGVTVVTARCSDGTQVGITANSFSSVSLDPPLVLVSLARSLRSFDALVEAPSFAINLLCREQQELSMRFARSGEDKWNGVATETGKTGAPLLVGRLAHFDCRPWARYDGGDHLILVGEIIDYGSIPNAEPLIYYRGSFQNLETPETINLKEAVSC